jgi:hypothetical protein
MDEDQLALLFATVEGETGLWELVWELNTRWGKRPENLAMARRIVRRLLGDGLIQVDWCDETDGALTPIADTELEAVLASERWWQPPGDDARSVRAWATEKGRAAYFAAG